MEKGSKLYVRCLLSDGNYADTYKRQTIFLADAQLLFMTFFSLFVCFTFFKNSPFVIENIFQKPQNFK